jgi:hypothetical protein
MINNIEKDWCSFSLVRMEFCWAGTGVCFCDLKGEFSKFLTCDYQTDPLGVDDDNED